jgi:hypothetical protein
MTDDTKSEREDTFFMVPGAVHSEAKHDHPGLCPDCLNREITGRAGWAKVQFVERDGKWVCPRSGPSYAEQLGPDGIRALGSIAPLI